MLALAFSPDGETLATASQDKRVRLYAVSSGALTHTLEGHSGNVIDVAFSPDGQTLISGSYDGSALRWDAKTGAPARPHALEHGAERLTDVAVSPDGLSVATGTEKKAARIWTLGERPKSKLLPGHDSRVDSVNFSPKDGRLVATAAGETVRLWDAHRLLLRTLQGHTGNVNEATFFSQRDPSSDGLKEAPPASGPSPSTAAPR